MHNTAAAQHTVAREISFDGIALHSGSVVHVRLAPAAENTGIVFHRTDINADIRADCLAVQETFLATTLCAPNSTASVSTVEHLLSAMAALAVDNLRVEIDGSELPILDGSAAPWWLLLNNACGLRQQHAARRFIRVKKNIETADNGRQVRFSPSENDSCRYDVMISYPHNVVNQSGTHFAFSLLQDNYEHNISRARTFCYVNDVEAMHRLQRAQGGSLQNAVVYDDKAVINPEGLRYPDEFVRHKLLDAIGDCYINGHLVLGNYSGNSPGHDMNNKLMRALMADANAWEWTEQVSG